METYKKIYIKSEADLPEEDAIYIAHSRVFDKVGSWEFRSYENDNFPDYCKKQWLNNVDWYLFPMEQETHGEVYDKQPTERNLGEVPQEPKEEINDIINCILIFDKTESLEAKGEYFEIIQRDLRKAVEPKEDNCEHCYEPIPCKMECESVQMPSVEEILKPYLHKHNIKSSDFVWATDAITAMKEYINEYLKNK